MYRKLHQSSDYQSLMQIIFCNVHFLLDIKEMYQKPVGSLKYRQTDLFSGMTFHILEPKYVCNQYYSIQIYMLLCINHSDSHILSEHQLDIKYTHVHTHVHVYTDVHLYAHLN